ncbi:MAG TPA: hypothetical protein VH352_15635 [Pseudonocardiaceae bacterium]|jgi:hypothetical protein|nr:hypothetical protein [Pseudonocardiaceae bacterium]
MRQAFAHEAVLVMGPDADLRAPGAAVTVALCGEWEHEPPCPLAPHHTRADRVGGDEVRLRVLFATEPDAETTVRQLIQEALSGGHLDGPDGTTTWRLHDSQHSDVKPDERVHADRLISEPAAE